MRSRGCDGMCDRCFHDADRSVSSCGSRVCVGGAGDSTRSAQTISGYRSINIVQPRFNSNYHSLQVFGQHRFSGSSQVNLAYTWSKNLSDNQTDRSTAPQDSFSTKGDYGRAALDRRHILTANWVYDLPFFDKGHGLASLLLGGWQFQGIATYQTGLPLTVTTSNYDPSGIGLIPALVAGARPDVICNPNANAPHTQQAWITPVFIPNPAFTPARVCRPPSLTRIAASSRMPVALYRTRRIRAWRQSRNGTSWHSRGTLDKASRFRDVEELQLQRGYEASVACRILQRIQLD
jgi:hypothetical protein